MENLEKRIEIAQGNREERSRLLAEYLPFLRKQIAGFAGKGLDYEDLQSIAMLVFVNCIRQYHKDRGTFLAFASTCIKHRLVDELRKQQIYRSRLSPDSLEKDGQIQLDTKAVSIYNQNQEHESLKEEILQLSDSLTSYGISWADLSKNCPKQKRSRLQCSYLAHLVVGKPEWKEEFLAGKRLPRAELARVAGVSEKTIEKYRKYIVALVVILLGDYPGIEAFLP